MNIVKNLTVNVSFHSKSSAFLSRGKQKLYVENSFAFNCATPVRPPIDDFPAVFTGFFWKFSYVKGNFRSLCAVLLLACFAIVRTIVEHRINRTFSGNEHTYKRTRATDIIPFRNGQCQRTDTTFATRAAVGIIHGFAVTIDAK